MKISVVTRHAPTNYGSLLQTIATQKILEKIGHQAIIIDYIRKDETGIKGVLTQLRRKNKWNNSHIKKLLYIILRYPSEKIAELKFASMRKRYLNMTKRYTTIENLRKYAETNDSEIYMTGSDQVWGGIADKNYDPVYFLDFVPDNKKKVAYAASFGKTEFTPDVLDEYKKYLSRYNHITVRETSAVKILEKLEIPCYSQVLDPTLLLTSREWDTMAVENKQTRYVLVYQIHNNPELSRYAKTFAKEAGLPLYRVSPSMHQIKRGGKFIYKPELGKFITLFKNAEYIITDSFHGTAFAINYNRQFFEILTDKKTSTRNLSILKLTGLEDRVITDYNDFTVKDKKINYERVNQIIETERKKSINAIKHITEK